MRLGDASEAALPVLDAPVRKDFLWLCGICYSAYSAVAMSRADVFLAKLGLFPPPVLVFFALTGGMLLLALSARRVAWRRLSTPYGIVVLPLMVLAAIALLQLARSENSSDDVKFAFMPLASLLAVAIVPFALAAVANLRAILIVALVVLIASIAVDVVIPGTFSKVPARPAGFPENPNQTGAVLCMLTALLLDYKQTKLSSIAWLAICAVAVLATLSRGGMVLFALLAVSFVGSRLVLFRGPAKIRMYVWIVLLGMVAVVGASQLLQSSTAYQGVNAQRRLRGLAGEDAFVRTDDARLQIADIAIGQINTSPILGKGAAASRLAYIAPHNMYLSLWWDYGIAAVLAYIAILVLGLMCALRRQQLGAGVFFAILAMAGMFSHTLLDARAVHFGFAVAMLLCAQRSTSRVLGTESPPVSVRHRDPPALLELSR
jgi:O-antigen ligase